MDKYVRCELPQNGGNMSSSDKWTVFGGAYSEVGDAMKDFAELQDLNVQGEVASYDAGLVTKEPSGMVILSNADSSGSFKGAAAGAMVGAVLGVVFPPSLIGLAALGAAGGAVAGSLSKHMGRGDFKDLGELLEPGESGILIVTERASDKAFEKLMSRASRKRAIKVEGDAEAIKAAVREVVGQE